ncbi:MAG: type II toxin-antitoxin system RelE/ParE family toxin [Patescibacteria group bacterium]
MLYKVVFTKAANKRIKKLDKRYSSAFDKSLKKLETNPRLGEMLKDDLKGYWKLKFSRYRIIYKIQGKKLIVVVVDVGHRREVYR